VNRSELIAFLRRHRLCIQGSVSSSGGPQAAVVGFAVSDEAEIVFDTIGTSRKMANLRRDPRIAVVVGWDDEQTAQIEGVADEPVGAELQRLKEVYFGRFPTESSGKAGRTSPTFVSGRRGCATAIFGPAAASSRLRSAAPATSDARGQLTRDRKAAGPVLAVRRATARHTVTIW